MCEIRVIDVAPGGTTGRDAAERTSPPGSDTKQTYVRTCTLETWFRGKEKTHRMSDSVPAGLDTAECVRSTFKVEFYCSLSLYLLILRSELTDINMQNSRMLNKMLIIKRRCSG